MFLDVHTHAFHPKIASKVLQQLEAHYGISPVGEGVVEDLLPRAKRAGLDGVVVHCAATAAAQVVPANAFAVELQRHHPEVVAFGTVHPEYADWEHQLDRLRAAGIRGLKLHPEFQGFRLDDPRLLPIIEAAQDDFVFMCHIGDKLPPAENASCPYKLAALLDAFPRARFIAAHLGGYLHWQYALEVLVGRDVWMDTSSSLSFIDDATLRAIFNGHDREHILFGSDYPLFDPADECHRLQRRLDLSDGEVEVLLSSAATLLGLNGQTNAAAPGA